MNLQQALENVSKACASINGNLDLHKALQESLQIIAQALSGPPKAEEPKKEDAKE